MADPVSSVAYAIEAALRALDGNLALLLPTMALVVAIIGVITLNYHQVVARFPEGGGSAAAAGVALGEAWAFVPIGALVVDFALTIAISVAAGASALIAYLPALAPMRVLVALALLLLVAGLTWFGHFGRTLFALMTLAFIATGAALLAAGFLHAPVMAATASSRVSVSLDMHAPGGFGTSAVAVVLAFPVAMALATGIEAPSSAIAQLGQLDAAGRRHFGQVTLWLTLGIVGALTLGLTILAERLKVGIPAPESTQIGDLARAVGAPWLFALFQLVTALLLLAAASSSFQAGPGLLKALARRPPSASYAPHPASSDHKVAQEEGILPSWLGRANRHYTPYWGVVVYLTVAAAVLIASNARDQVLVLFYAVAVFLSFLVGLVAMTRLAWGEQRHGSLVVNGAGALVVAFTLVMNLVRGVPLISLGAALVIAGALYVFWVRAGRPRGIAQLVRNAETVEEGGLEIDDREEREAATPVHDSSNG
jgi:hypothetical protein